LEEELHRENEVTPATIWNQYWYKWWNGYQ
jgi:hypothetical protein